MAKMGYLVYLVNWHRNCSDANNNRTGYEYDGYDRLYRTYYPSPTTPGTTSTTDYEQLTLDNNGNTTARRLRNGNSISYYYNALNQVTFKGGATVADTDYSYDVAGRLTSATDDSRTVSFTYDALNRQLTDGQQYGTMSYDYDAAGRRTKMTWGNGAVLYVNYDYLTTGEVSAPPSRAY